RRLAVADDRFADHRAAAVGADQRLAADALAARFHGDAPAIEVEAGDARARPQLDQLARLAAVEQRTVDVRAVRHRVGIAEALGEAFVERDLDHRLAAHAVHHQQALDEDRLLLDQLADAEG